MGNYYLSSIQQGIQAAHALGEMGLHNGDNESFCEWIDKHKTMVLLNGGNSASLRELWTLLSDPRNKEFPVSKFHEDKQSLDGALTCVAIVLPEYIYDAKWVERADCDGVWWFEKDGYGKQIDGWEAELLDVIKKLPLAR
jgi:hypothetical protein